MDFEDLEQGVMSFFNKLGEDKEDKKVVLEGITQNLLQFYFLKRNMSKSVQAIEKLRRGEPLDKKDLKAFGNVVAALPHFYTVARMQATQGYYKVQEALERIKAQAAADEATADVMRDSGVKAGSSFFDKFDEGQHFADLEELSTWIKNGRKPGDKPKPK